MILANNNGSDVSDNIDIGIIGTYYDTGAGTADYYSGIFRDADDKKWKIFKTSQDLSTASVVNTGLGTYAYGTLVANIEAHELSIASDLTVTGASTFNGTVSIDSTLDVTGLSTLDQVSVTNTLTTGYAIVNNNTTVTGDLDVSGNGEITGTFDVTGIVNLNNTTDSSSTITGALIVDGGVGIAKKLYVGGASTFEANVVVTSGNSLSGVIIASNTSTAVTQTTDNSSTLIATTGFVQQTIEAKSVVAIPAYIVFAIPKNDNATTGNMDNAVSCDVNFSGNTYYRVPSNITITDIVVKTDITSGSKTFNVQLVKTTNGGITTYNTNSSATGQTFVCDQGNSTTGYSSATTTPTNVNSFVDFDEGDYLRVNIVEHTSGTAADANVYVHIIAISR